MNKKPGNILVVTYWDYNEAHIQANVLPNLEILSKELGHEREINLFCFNKKPLSRDQEEAVRKRLQPHRIRLIWFHYTHFGFRMIARFLWLIPYLCGVVFSRKVNQVYAWCTTAGAVGYLVSVCTRRPLILESYEPHAEAMVENGHWTKTGMAYKLLSWFEKKQAKRARYIIAANGGMRDYVEKRYGYTIPREIFFVKPACVEENVFYPDEEKRAARRKQLGYTDEHLVCVYAGKFGGIYLDRETFAFFKAARERWGDRFRVLLLTPHKPAEIEAYCATAGLSFTIFTILYVSHPEVPDYMRAADFGICPVKPVPTKRYCTPVKDGEYWATGLPVVITHDISDDSAIIAETRTGAVIRSLDDAGYRNAVSVLEEVLEEDRATLVKRVRELALRYRNYRIAGEIYKSVYNIS